MPCARHPRPPRAMRLRASSVTLDVELARVAVASVDLEGLVAGLLLDAFIVRSDGRRRRRASCSTRRTQLRTKTSKIAIEAKG
jgi:hypothetical protein